LNTVLGYHGCSKETAHHLLGGFQFQPSNKSYDWLGEGSYFWEEDITRAYEWAIERRSAAPCVVGAVIDVGNCLDLTKRSGITAVRSAYDSYRQLQQRRNQPLPENQDSKDGRKGDLVLRPLDRAVIDHLHSIYRSASERDGGRTKEFDTVRAMFPEGEPLYATAGFLEKTHVQIAVRKPTQIVGVFRVPSFILKLHGLPEMY
jgi:hypothetical protein